MLFLIKTKSFICYLHYLLTIFMLLLNCHVMITYVYVSLCAGVILTYCWGFNHSTPLLIFFVNECLFFQSSGDTCVIFLSFLILAIFCNEKKNWKQIFTSVGL